MYDLMLASAVVVWIVGCGLMAQRARLQLSRVAIVVAFAAGAMFLGARLHSIFFEQGVTVVQFVNQPLRYLSTAGHRLPGGAILALVTLMAGALAMKIPAGCLYDTLLIPYPLAIAVARVGCWLEGCCFGKLTTAPWGVTHSFGSEAYRNHVERGLVTSGFESLPVHPLALYMIASSLLLLPVGLYVWKRRSFDGEAAIAIIGLSTARSWILEFFREDALVSQVSYRQGTWLVLAAIALAAWPILRMRARPSARQPRMAVELRTLQ